MHTVLTLFGTRPELIKLAPIIEALERKPDRFRSIHVLSSQHTDLIRPFIEFFRVRVDHDLDVMRPGQQPVDVVSRILTGLQPIFDRDRPDVVLVQGDTATAMAGALAAFYRGARVGHVEAGLRTSTPRNPFPEEMHRRIITRLADWHFAATGRNVDTLLAEGVDPKTVFLTGNPVVDALKTTLERASAGPEITALLEKTRGQRRLVLTTHRRESFGETMTGNLSVLRRFVEAHDDVVLVFPVHPNPSVRAASAAALGTTDKIHLLPPQGYPDFIRLLASAWLVVSDSGGVQEEVPSLGRPLLILRENTERPEVVEAGVARLVKNPAALEATLAEIDRDPAWIERAGRVENPFGDGTSGAKIADILEGALA
jgi:UDP-N-acetylglucosamine 2-epimerase (non-hydrolysing)